MLKTAAENYTVDGVGVIVGRFQVSELTDGHKELIKSVMDRHKHTVCVVGLSQIKATKNNPLDFESRRKMLFEEFSDLSVVYIKDMKDDKQWSKNLDDVISTQVPPSSKVTLYGSRDSFISYYTGKYDTIELIQESYVSGTENRVNNSYSVSDSKDFRKGVIWATQNQYDSCFPTVDIAIVDREHDRLLLARKSYETKYRFVGGFVEPNTTISPNNYLEQAARRELIEETHLETGKFDYVGSFLVDDWRYRCETNKIVTTLFKTDYTFGKPNPDDDIVELKWFTLDSNTKLFDNIVDEHKPLLNEFLRSEELYDLMVQVNN